MGKATPPSALFAAAFLSPQVKAKAAPNAHVKSGALEKVERLSPGLITVRTFPEFEAFAPSLSLHFALTPCLNSSGDAVLFWQV